MSSDAESSSPQNVDPQTVLGPNAQRARNSGGHSGPQHIYVHHLSGGFRKFLGRLFLIGGWLAVVVLVFMLVYLRKGRSEYYDTTAGVLERFHSGSASADERIAIITVRGVIFSGDGFVKRQIDRVRDDETVKAVVLRVESPGGTVSGSDYIFHHLKKLRDDRKIPIVVSMGSIAASGGYYVAMAAGNWNPQKTELNQSDMIFAEETTTTGSIGVIIPHYDLSEFLAEHKIENDSIARGDNKQMLSMTKPITPEQRTLLEAHVNELYVLFKKRVQEGRPNLDKTKIDGLATGEIFTAQKAHRLGLVDKLGFIEDAITRAADLAGLKSEDARVVKYVRPPTLLDQFIELAEARQPSVDLRAVLDMSTPQAYYLFTTLPPLVSTRNANDVQ